MKKLMVMAVAVAIGLVANAANCNWSTYAMDEAYNGLDNGTYWLISLGTDTGASSAFEVKADGTYNFGAYSVVDTGTIAAGTYGAASGTLTGLGESDNGSYYALVVWDGKADGKYGVAEGAIAGIVANPPSDATPINFDNSGFGGTMFANTAVAAVAVPEPTSGLLMLVGLAGLALRRRRA